MRTLGPLFVVGAIVLVFLPLSPSYDLADFLRAGHAALTGGAVYPAPGSRAVYSGSAFVYPYFALWPFLPLAALPAALSRALVFALTVAAVLAACRACSDEHDPWPSILVLASSFAISGLQLGALSPLEFAGAVALWRLRDRPVVFGLLAAPVVGAKLFLAPLLLWPILAGRWRAFAYASVATAALLILGFAVGPIGILSYSELLSALGAHESAAGFGVIGALMRSHVPAAAAQVAAGALAALVLGAAWLHDRREHDERVLFSGAILAALLLTPVLWSHYLLCLAAIPLVFRARARWFVLLAAGSWAVAAPHGVHLVSTGPLAHVNVAGLALAVASFLAFVLGSLIRTRATREAAAVRQ
ncbi:MAG TPA: glycosyltransferase 87 family protein [Solirubrobacteraceae bacterium]|nr:glycosyltransferase 87 family protein [Solirubrobacteraceae bacterium]